jgi:hypothetical protein
LELSKKGTLLERCRYVLRRDRAAHPRRLASCSLNTFRDSIMSVSHCIDNYVPGILD